jgi:hypothetical protein
MTMMMRNRRLMMAFAVTFALLIVVSLFHVFKLLTCSSQENNIGSALLLKASPSLSSRKGLQRETALCEGYDGILFISHVFRRAGAGTLFFQSIVDSLIYAEKYNLLPWIWINDAKNGPCYDREFHGQGPKINFTHLSGGIKDVIGNGGMTCTANEGKRPGPPDFDSVEPWNFQLVGNGLWQSYFEPLSHHPYKDPSCASKPIFEMTPFQVFPGMHRCSEFAVRGWPFKDVPEALLPNGHPMKDWLWNHRQRAAWMVEKYFRVKPEIQAEIDRANPVDDGHCVAAHIRLTDKASGRDKKGLEYYRPYIKAYADANPDGKIYIATDDGNALDAIRRDWTRKITSRVIFQEGAFRSRTEDLPTFELLKNNKHRSNLESLVEIYAMAKCSYFVHGFSGMAEAVVYINPQLHQRSVNIDDEGDISPQQFFNLVSATSGAKRVSR